MKPSLARRIARRFGVQLFDGDRAGAVRVAALALPGCSPLVAHRRGDSPEALRARCRLVRRCVEAMRTGASS